MKEYNIKVKGQDYKVRIAGVESGKATVYVNEEKYEVEVAPDANLSAANNATPVVPISSAANTNHTEVLNSVETLIEEVNNAQPDGPKIGMSGKSSVVKSPLPGKILDIMIKVGDKVAVGQSIICLEAMKMENNIYSEHAGVIKNIFIQKNDTVLEGDKLIEIGY